MAWLPGRPILALSALLALLYMHVDVARADRELRKGLLAKLMTGYTQHMDSGGRVGYARFREKSETGEVNCLTQFEPQVTVAQRGIFLLRL